MSTNNGSAPVFFVDSWNSVKSRERTGHLYSYSDIHSYSSLDQSVTKISISDHSPLAGWQPSLCPSRNARNPKLKSKQYNKSSSFFKPENTFEWTCSGVGKSVDSRYALCGYVLGSILRLSITFYHDYLHFSLYYSV